MTEFWIVAALLILLAAGFVLWPLLRRQVDDAGDDISGESENVAHFQDQLADLEHQRQANLISDSESQRLKAELEKKLVEELEQEQTLSVHSARKTPVFALVLALLVPAMALPLYWELGAQTELNVQEVLTSNNATPESVQKTLEQWVDKKPENDKALFLLASHYMENGGLGKAENVYRKLFRVSNGHPQVAAELAQTLFLKQGNQVTDEVRRLYKRALAGDETNTTAMGLKGIDAFASANYQEAIKVWQTAMQYEASPAARQSLAQGINKAREMLGFKPANGIKVLIDRSPELVALPNTARVVIFARPAGTRQPPIIAIPLTLGELPKELILDDSSAMMMGGVQLSSYDALDIVGRISLSGDVMTADYQVQVSDVKTDAHDLVKLTFTPAG